MAQIESIDDVMARKGSIAHLWKIIDPENRFSYATCLEEWYRMDLTAQRKMYLYLLYRRWRGLDIYGDPFSIIHNCHPVPFNWNGQTMVNSLIKEKRVVSAKYNGSFGIYTWDEARVWQMTDVKPLN